MLGEDVFVFALRLMLLLSFRDDFPERTFFSDLPITCPQVPLPRPDLLPRDLLHPRLLYVLPSRLWFKLHVDVLVLSDDYSLGIFTELSLSV